MKHVDNHLAFLEHELAWLVAIHTIQTFLSLMLSGKSIDIVDQEKMLLVGIIHVFLEAIHTKWYSTRIF